MIEFAGAVAWLIRSREIIAVASGKAAKTILALKTYSHTDIADQGVDIDIPVELDTILGLSVTPISGGVEVAVSDTGPGVPAQIADHIFDAFFTTKRPGEGSGLGLSICQKIVTAHGGSIHLESVPGRTVFVVRPPLGKPSSPA